jgi:tripartite-type tricarboxylate transporter receptor subunit TctC
VARTRIGNLARAILKSVAMAAAVSLSAGTPAQAQSVADFYKANRISVIVTSPPGGGYDLNARTLARHLSRHIPGIPAVVVQNMPGADGMLGANHVANVAPRDGTVIGVGTRTTPYGPLFGFPGARYDATALAWLGSTASETGVTVAWHTAPVKTAEDLFKTDLIIGAGSQGGDLYVFPHVLNSLLGTRFKIVGGYASLPPIGLAMERGEVQGVGNYTWTTLRAGHADWIAEKKVVLLMQLGLTRHVDLPQVPLVLDFARTEEQRQLLSIFMSMKTFGFPFFASPGVPADRVKALRLAFDETMADPAFIAESRAQHRDVAPSSGEEMQEALRQTYALPPALIAKARALLPAGR